jgi:hypothetical protein
LIYPYFKSYLLAVLSFLFTSGSLLLPIVKPRNPLDALELSLLVLDHGGPVSVHLVGIYSPGSQILPTHPQLPEWLDARTHGASKSGEPYPIFVPNILLEVSISFCVPV